MFKAAVRAHASAPQARSRRLGRARLTLIGVLALAACGPGSKTGGSGGRTGGDGTGGISGSVGGQGVPGGSGGSVAALGLDRRPTNTTCLPPPSVDSPAPKLSQTGCVDPADPKKPAAGLIPYGVNSPLWSDGADKERFIALPEGTTITIKDCARDSASCRPVESGGTFLDQGDMEVPDGTVLVKTFAIGGKMIETRLLVRFNRDTWVGYSYEWNDAGTDADVLPDTLNGKQKMIAGLGGKQQLWHFPTRAECLRCHTDAAGVSLGLETGQLNGQFKYPGTGRTANQMATLAAIGVFSAPPPAPAAMAALPSPTDTRASLDERARSYLHANCAICHRPKGNFEAMDYRFSTPLAQRGLCNADPEKGELGVPGAKRLVPGMPEKSLTWLRMDTLDRAQRMPQIGSAVKDQPGNDLVAAWIRGLTACP